MYLIKNALKNLRRNKGRNILVGLIMLAIVFAVSVSIVINTTVTSVTEDYKARFGSEIMLVFDSEAASQYTNVQYPTAKQQMEIGKSGLLQKTDYESGLSVVLKGLKALDDDKKEKIGSLDMNRADEEADDYSANAKVKSTSNPSISKAFEDGTRSVISGRVFQNPGECIVSEEFAKLNGLEPGDKITVTNTKKKELMPFTFTVSGIYRDNLPHGNAAFSHPLFNSGNEILTDMDTAMGMELFEQKGELNATYYLKDPSTLPAFEKEARAKGLAEYYRVTTDEEGYNRIIGPVEGISGIVTAFLIVVLVFGGVVLLFLSVMAVRERKYEIGVLRAMGLKRRKVIAGMVCESLIIVGVCLIIGLGLSVPLSQPVADTLLENQIQLEKQEKQNQGVIKIGGDSSASDVVSDITVRMTPQAIAQIVSLALLLVLVSSMAGILAITRFEPIKILSERG